MGHTRSHPAFPSLALSWLFTNGFCPFHSINTSLKATVRAKVTFHLSVDPSSWRPLRLWAMQAELWPTPKSGFKKYAKQYYFSYFGFPVFVFLRVKAISYLIEYINFALKKKWDSCIILKNFIPEKHHTLYLYISLVEILLASQPLWDTRLACWRAWEKTSKKPKSSITRVGLAARHLKHSAKSLWKHVKPLKMPLVGLPWWSSG